MGPGSDNKKNTLLIYEHALFMKILKNHVAKMLTFLGEKNVYKVIMCGSLVLEGNKIFRAYFLLSKNIVDVYEHLDP